MTALVLDYSIAMRWAFDGAARGHADSVVQSLESFIGEAVVPDDMSR